VLLCIGSQFTQMRGEKFRYAHLPVSDLHKRGGLQVVYSKEDTLQAQQPVWKFLQKHSVVNFVVKTSVVAVVSLTAVSGVSVSLSGEGIVAHSTTNCAAGEHTYTVAHGDSWSALATHFHLTQDLLSDSNKQVSSIELQANEKICTPGRKQHLAITKVVGFASVTVVTRAVKKVATLHFSARVIRSVRTSTQTPVAVKPNVVDIIQEVPPNNPPSQPAQAGMTGYGNPFPYPACTWWADQRYYQIHGIYVPWSNGANAWQWSSRAAEYGWRVSGTPMVGSIMVLQPYVDGAEGYGHVAYVEQILNNNRVIASSMNWGANPYTVTQGVFSSGGGVTFIHQ
jgi:surface antigen